MDCRAVLIFLCVLAAQTACVSVKDRTPALNRAIQLIRGEIGSLSRHLTGHELLPNISCRSLNFTELLGSEQQQELAAHHFSSIRCYLMEMSKLIPELSNGLKNMSQYIQGVEQQMSGGVDKRDCSLPSFEQNLDRYQNIRCLLELLHQKLSKPKN